MNKFKMLYCVRQYLKHILISYEVRRQNSWKNLKNYKQLIDESLVTKNKEQFLKKCDEFTEEVIKRIFYQKMLLIYIKRILLL